MKTKRESGEGKVASREGEATARRLARWLVLAVVLVALPPVVSATTRTVSNLNDSGAGSLRDTIAASGSGDTINFSVTGVIQLTSGELQVNHSLTINGPGSGLLTINRLSSSNFRIFYFDNGAWTLSGVTLSNGNDGAVGGGLYNGNGNLTLNNCVLEENTSGQMGGGIGNSLTATTTMNACVLELNRSANSGGGGVYNAGTLTMHDCTFENNSSASDGGGVFNDGTLTVTTSTFVGNTGAGGGAIYCEKGNATLQNCTFSANEGTGNALRVGSATLTVQSCTFSGNDAQFGGTIYVFQNDAVVQIGNTILAGRPPDSTISVKDGTTPSITSLGYNLISDNGGAIRLTTGDQLNADPVFDPNGLQNNGGATETIALGYGSPAIDRGKNFGLATDQRGNTRTYDNANLPNAPGGDGTDIGAFEAAADPVQAGSNLVVTTTADHDDGVCGGVDCTLREAINRSAAAYSFSYQPPIVFAPNLTGTITVLSSLTISSPTIINGPGARTLAISGGQAQRIFYVNTSATQSQITGLTLRDGIVITNQNHGEVRQGGAIFNAATLELDDCALTNNVVSGAMNISNGGNGGAGQGGAICNEGTLFLNRCTFAGNTVTGRAGTTYSGTEIRSGGTGGAGQGGAIFNDSGATVEIETCTFSGNSAVGGAGAQGTSNSLLAGGGNANGAGICNLGTASVASCTISGNTGSGGAGVTSGVRHGAHGSGNGGASSSGGMLAVANTIIAANAGNTAPDVEGAFDSNGYNLVGIGDQGSGFTATGDQVGSGASPIDPRLSQLANNGGGTDTMRLVYASPALDRGSSFGINVDQRGSPRPVESVFADASAGDGADIGAVEINLTGGPDSDGDGMSDDFEFFFGLDSTDPTDAVADFDHDGLTNRQEFQAGTNPLDSNSRLQVTSVVKSGNDLIVSFATAVPHKSYRLERKDALTDSMWGSITGASDFGASSVGTGQITDPGGAAATKHFYRVRILP